MMTESESFLCSWYITGAFLMSQSASWMLELNSLKSFAYGYTWRTIPVFTCSCTLVGENKPVETYHIYPQLTKY